MNWDFVCLHVIELIHLCAKLCGWMWASEQATELGMVWAVVEEKSKPSVMNFQSTAYTVRMRISSRLTAWRNNKLWLTHKHKCSNSFGIWRTKKKLFFHQKQQQKVAFGHTAPSNCPFCSNFTDAFACDCFVCRNDLYASKQEKMTMDLNRDIFLETWYDERRISKKENTGIMNLGS